MLATITAQRVTKSFLFLPGRVFTSEVPFEQSSKFKKQFNPISAVQIVVKWFCPLTETALFE